jgi:hypothetical protein
MNHVKPEQFVDLAEGTLPETAVPHLAACQACRRELAGLRAMMAEASHVEAPEPSPLFWDHFSARVREAVAEEGARPRTWRERVLQPVVLVPSVTGALAVLLAVILLPRAPMETPATIASTPLIVAANTPLPSSTPSLPPYGSADDPQLGIVAAVANTAAWDEMMDEVAMANSISGDAVVSALTVDERRELQRLLTEEMAQQNTSEKRS